MTKYKEIINATQEELEKEFPWLKEADFEDAVIKLWEDGIWEYGTWEDGEMWSNIDQKHVEVKQENGKFIKI